MLRAVLISQNWDLRTNILTCRLWETSAEGFELTHSAPLRTSCTEFSRIQTEGNCQRWYGGRRESCERKKKKAPWRSSIFPGVLLPQLEKPYYSPIILSFLVKATSMSDGDVEFRQAQSHAISTIISTASQKRIHHCEFDFIETDNGNDREHVSIVQECIQPGFFFGAQWVQAYLQPMKMPTGFWAMRAFTEPGDET